MGGDVHVGEASRSQDGAGCGRIGQRERIGGRSRGRLFAGEDLIDDPLWRRRMTARNALRLLQDEGLITAEHGRGVYVRARPPVRRLASDRFAQRHRKEGKAAFDIEAEQHGATPQVDQLTVTEATPPAEVADRLSISDGSPVVVRVADICWMASR